MEAAQTQNKTSAESCETSWPAFVEAMILKKLARSLIDACFDCLGKDGLVCRVQILTASIEKLVLEEDKPKRLVINKGLSV